MTDRRDLSRFVVAQDAIWPTPLDELRRGRKLTHWMWFVFPQIAGLGRSATATFYALADRAEARAYLAHPLLGPRLAAAVAALAAAPDRIDAATILGDIDAVKLRSSLTLFAAVADDPTIFEVALARWFEGERDPETVRRL